MSHPNPSIALATLQVRAGATPDSALRSFRAYNYPKYAVYLVVSFIFVIFLSRITSLASTQLCIRRARRRINDDSVNAVEKQVGERAKSNGRITPRRIPLALLSGARILMYRVTLPIGAGMRLSFAETAVSASYIMAMLTFEFANARNVSGALDTEYWANRAGTLAVSQLAFIVALAGKNNIISLLTGISYEKLNIIHRMASRMLFILIWVHMWGRWKLGLTGKHALTYGWMQAGVLAAVALTLAVILSARMIRERVYELFLVGHVVLIFIFLLSGFYHVKHNDAFLPYTWSPFIVWGLDRFLRLFRTLYIRYLSSKCKGNPAQAVLEVLSSDTLRATLRTADSRLLRWRPGQSAYLTVPSVSSSPLEAHPFTIASIDEPVSVDGKNELELKFIIRARRGFTGRLHEKAVRAGGKCLASAFVDGPYGEPPTVHASPGVIFVAGKSKHSTSLRGSGVSFTLPLLLDIVRRARHDVSRTLCRRVLFVWFVRERGHIGWISNDIASLRRDIPAGIDIDIRVFVTGKDDAPREPIPNIAIPSLASVNGQTFGEKDADVQCSPVDTAEEKPDYPTSESSSEENARTKKCNSINPLVSVMSGRPSVQAILEEEISSFGDAVGVSVSGPQSLINDVRNALRNPKIAGPMIVLRGAGSVILHIENFGM